MWSSLSVVFEHWKQTQFKQGVFLELILVSELQDTREQKNTVGWFADAILTARQARNLFIKVWLTISCHMKASLDPQAAQSNALMNLTQIVFEVHFLMKTNICKWDILHHQLYILMQWEVWLTVITTDDHDGAFLKNELQKHCVDDIWRKYNVMVMYGSIKCFSCNNADPESDSHWVQW